jgi:hypothetical protein
MCCERFVRIIAFVVSCLSAHITPSFFPSSIHSIPYHHQASVASISTTRVFHYPATQTVVLHCLCLRCCLSVADSLDAFLPSSDTKLIHVTTTAGWLT